jgi:hypothetical protein
MRWVNAKERKGITLRYSSKLVLGWRGCVAIADEINSPQNNR